jgi:hypothetical protein
MPAKKQSAEVAKLVIPTATDLNAFGAKKSKIEMLADSKDQRATMKELVGDLSTTRVMGNRVLVGIYIEPSYKGSLFLSKETLKESVYQGTVGLVLKKGPQAFKDDPDNKINFRGENAEEGEWVVFRAGDAKRCQIKGLDCRFVEDTLIDMVVADPNLITHEKI